MKHSETYKLACAMNTEKQYSEYKIIDTTITPVYEGAPAETHPEDWQGGGKNITKIEINKYGFRTYVTDTNMMFPDKSIAYIITDVTTTPFTSHRVTSVPKNTPLFLYGDPGIHDAYIIDSKHMPTTFDDTSANLLLASDGTVVSDGETIYVLNAVNGKPTFVKLAKDRVVSKGTAYLIYNR